MSQNVFPAFTDMMPNVEDIQLIVDSLRQEDRSRITRDGIFNPGIVNQQDEYLQSGTNENSLKIKPFIAYTANGNRIEVASTWDNLYAQGNVITVTNANLVSTYENIPVWYAYAKTYESFDQTAENYTESLQLATLGRGSILHGIKLRINSLFNITGAETQPNIWVSIGTQSEPEKFLPPTLVSADNLSTNLSVMNLMYSIDDANPTNIIITFTSDSVFLNTLTNGSLTVNLCIANLSGFDNEELIETVGGYQLSNTSVGTWQPSTTYHIVARYEETPSNYRQLNYTTIDGTNISTTSEPTRFTTTYSFYALRKTGSIIDYTTLDDVKLGEIVTDANGNINHIYVNGKNNSGDLYTQYLTLPGYRFTEGINASQIGDGSVTNEQFSYLSTLTGNVQSQLNSKANLNTDNIFTGINTFEQQIVGSIDKVNGFSAYATPIANSLLVLDENAKIPGEAISESTIASIGNFYTVSNGVTSNGRASFLTPNSTLDGVKITADSSNPLVLNYPDGSVERITTDQNIGGLASDGYYYLIKERNGNFIFLPTSGGTKACIPVVSAGNSFYYEGEQGTVSNYYEGSTAYRAFNGTITDGTSLGKITYTNYNNVETTGYLPSDHETYLAITFPTAIVPTGFAACFRAAQYDATPKAWTFEATNDTDLETATWTQLYQVQAANPSTWGINEIKTFALSGITAFKTFRFVFNVNETTINNYMAGEETSATGVTMPINCYYFQLYATNTDTTNKGNVIEGYKQPTGMSMGSYFLDISKKPYTGYKCIGNNQFSPVDYVKLGFVNLTGYGTANVVITCYPFCYNTFTLSEETSISKNTPITFNHNLGVIPNIIDVKFRCLVANNGYSAGDYCSNLYCSDTNGLTSIKDSLDSTVTSVKMWPGTPNSTLYVKNKNTGALGTINNAEWAMIVYCSRGW